MKNVFVAGTLSAIVFMAPNALYAQTAPVPVPSTTASATAAPIPTSDPKHLMDDGLQECRTAANTVGAKVLDAAKACYDASQDYATLAGQSADGGDRTTACQYALNGSVTADAFAYLYIKVHKDDENGKQALEYAKDGVQNLIENHCPDDLIGNATRAFKVAFPGESITTAPSVSS